MAFWSPSSITPINQGAEPGNLGDGDTIRNAFTYVENNFSAISSQLASVNQDFLNANVTNSLNVGVTTTGNLAVGNVTTASTFYGNINIAANIIPTQYGIYNLGSPERPFGNLYVQATISTTQIAASSDAGLLLVHANTSPGDVKDVGIIGNVSNHFSSNMYAFFGYQATSNNFVYKLTPNNAATIGNSVVYDGAYGNVHFGALYLSNTTAATSNITGALIVAGGISSNASVHAAGNVFSRGYRVLNTADVQTLGYPVYNGSGSLFVGNTVFATTTPSTTTTTGAIVVLGGIGVAGNVVAGGYLGDYFGNIRKPEQPFINTVGSLGNLTVIGTTSTNSLQATSIGVSGIVSTSITTSTLTGTSASLVNLTVTNKATIGNIDVTTGNITVSTDNTAVGFVTSGGLTNSLLTLNKSTNTFIQSAIHNSSSGTSASSDFIAYADNGTNTKGYVDLGIASTGFNDPAYAVTKAGDAYLFVSAPTGKNGNLVIATDGVGPGAGSIIFSSGGFTTGGQKQAEIINGDGLHLAGNLVATTGKIYQGEGAKTLEIDNYFYSGYAGLTNASGIFVGNENAFVQLAMRNHSAGTSASTDLIAYSSNGDNNSGWIDVGITSENYADSTYGVTGPHDGYLFMSAPVGTTGNGSVYISTSNNGAHNDVVFSTNGFGASNERMRIVGQGRAGKPAGVEIYIPTTSTSTSTGALRVQGGVGIQGNLNIAGNVSIIGNLTFGGTGTNVSTSTLTVENPILFLANANSDNSQDSGIVSQYKIGATTYYTGITRQAATGQWRVFDRATTKASNTVTFNGVHGGMVMGSANIANTTVSTSSTTGALVVTGGVGIGGSINIAGGMSITGSMSITSDIIPTANLVSNLGSTSKWFNTFYGVSTQAKYADLAENYQADKAYTPGTVVIFGGKEEITTTTEFADTCVAGAISTEPAHLMNGGLTGTNVVALALRGRVPCRVFGPVQKGDLLVTAGDNPGCAVSVGRDRLYSLSVFAKSLETDLSGGEKIIEVVIL